VEVEEYARIAAAEDDHWWYRNTRALVGDLLAPWLTRDRRILDAGCGPGGNGAWLAEHGTVVGVDVSPDALTFVRARRPETRPVRASIAALPFPDASFDVVVGITVLYTIDDDHRALRELARVLAPGGALLLFEPAFESLRREHDVTVHGRRRYRRTELVQQVEDNGLTVERATYAYSFLAPPAAVLGGLERMRRPSTGATDTASPGSDVERRTLDRAFEPLARAERRVLVHRDVPFGTSVIVVAAASHPTRPPTGPDAARRD
jgi:SAM-dependent methyltransferase